MKIEMIIRGMAVTAVCALTGPMAFGFAGGDGSPGNPWQISTEAHLQAVDDVITYYEDDFVVINDIVVSPGWIPIFPRKDRPGRADVGPLPLGSAKEGYSGTFDGGGFTIDGCDNPLFDTLWAGQLAADPTIKNIVLENVNITGYTEFDGGTELGALVGRMNSSAVGTSIENVHVRSGSVSDSVNNVGGLIGGSYATIIECSAAVSVSGVGRIGGLVGVAAGGSITLSEALGDVNGTSVDCGGLIGLLQGNVTVFQCFAMGNVTTGVGDFYIGGLIGECRNGSPTIRECFATGNVIASSDSAGLIGGTVNTTADISDCYTTGDVTVFGSPNRVGGLIGEMGRFSPAPGDLVERCYAKGNITGSGLLGQKSTGQGVVVDSYAADGTVTVLGFAFTSGAPSVNCFWSNNGADFSGASFVADPNDFHDPLNDPVNLWDTATVWCFPGNDDPCLQWASTCCPPPVCDCDAVLQAVLDELCDDPGALTSFADIIAAIDAALAAAGCPEEDPCRDDLLAQAGL